MSNIDFFGLLYTSPSIFLGCLVLALSLYILIFRKWFVSILDPFILAAVGSACGFSVVLFLLFIGEIEWYYFMSYFVSQAALFGGMFVFNRLPLKKPKQTTCFKNQENLLQLIFLIVSVCTIGAQMLIYATKGIPLFMESRLEANTGGDGGGIFFRFLPVWGTLSLLLSYYFIDHRTKFKALGYFMVTLMAAFALLSGSKSAIWTLAVCFFGYSILFSDRFFRVLKRREMTFVGLAVLIAVLGLMLNSEGSMGESALSFIFRFVFSGDVYWATYPEGAIESLDRSEPLVVIFSDLLGMFRIVPWNEQPEPLGFSIFKLHNISDIMGGPNPRHNILGYVLFGFTGGAVFSFLVGSVIGLVRNLFYNSRNRNILVKFIVIIAYNMVYGLEADVSYTLSLYNSLLFLTILIIFIVLLCYVDFSPRRKIVKIKN